MRQRRTWTLAITLSLTLYPERTNHMVSICMHEYIRSSYKVDQSKTIIIIYIYSASCIYIYIYIYIYI